jgi:hypothetical protein
MTEVERHKFRRRRHRRRWRGLRAVIEARERGMKVAVITKSLLSARLTP